MVLKIGGRGTLKKWLEVGDWPHKQAGSEKLGPCVHPLLVSAHICKFYIS